MNGNPVRSLRRSDQDARRAPVPSGPGVGPAYEAASQRALPAAQRTIDEAYRVEARPVVDKGAYARLIEHSPFAYLMGPKGDFLTLFPPIVPPRRMAAIIRGYLR